MRLLPDGLDQILPTYGLYALCDRDSPARKQFNTALEHHRHIYGYPTPVGASCPYCGDQPRQSVAEEIADPACEMSAATWLLHHCLQNHFKCRICLRAAEEKRKEEERAAKARGELKKAAGKTPRTAAFGSWIGYLNHMKDQHVGHPL